MSKSDITENAKRLFTELQLNGDFTASSGWVRKFLKRNKLSNRRVTGHAQKIPDNAAVQCMAFIDQAHSIIREKGEIVIRNGIVFTQIVFIILSMVFIDFTAMLYSAPCKARLLWTITCNF